MMRITPVTKFLLLVNVVVFLFMASSLSTLVPLFDFQDLEDMLGLHFFLAPHFLSDIHLHVCACRLHPHPI